MCQDVVCVCQDVVCVEVPVFTFVCSRLCVKELCVKDGCAQGCMYKSCVCVQGCV